TGRVIAFVEKPPPDEAPTNLINAGTYVLEPSVLDRIPTGRRVSIERETFPSMVEGGSLYAVSDGGVYWLDMGTPETYIQAQLDLVAGRRDIPSPVDAVADGAEIAPTAVVESSIIGAKARIGPGALVAGSVVLPGASIGVNARVVDSIVGP